MTSRGVLLNWTIIIFVVLLVVFHGHLVVDMLDAQKLGMLLFCIIFFRFETPYAGGLGPPPFVGCPLPLQHGLN